MDEISRYTDPPKPMTRTRIILYVLGWSPVLALLVIGACALLQGPAGRQMF